MPPARRPAQGLHLPAPRNLEKASVPGIHADAQQVAVRRQQPEFVDQRGAERTLGRAGARDLGPDQAAAIAVMDMLGKLVEGQGPEILGSGPAGRMRRPWRHRRRTDDDGQQKDQHGQKALHGLFYAPTDPNGNQTGRWRSVRHRGRKSDSEGRDNSLAGHTDTKERTKVMSRKLLGIAAASLAMAAGLGTVSLAQDAAPAAQPGDLPAMLQALNLQDVEVKQGPRGGRKIEGDLPGGGEIEAFVDAKGNVVMVEADDVDMPPSLLEALLPQAVRDNAMLSQFTEIERIGGFDGRVMISGEDASGEDVRAAFGEDGRLLRFGRGDDDDRRHGWREGHRGDDRGGDRGRMGGKDWHHGKEGPGRGPRDETRGPGHGMPPGLDTAALTGTLEAAGYSALGDARPAGPRLMLEATNPAGEPVMLEVDPAGEILRETAR